MKVRYIRLLIVVGLVGGSLWFWSLVTYDPSPVGSDGPYESYYENGQLQEKGTFSNGEPDGPWESYYENGQLHKKGSYSNGEQVGPYEEYYENGQFWVKGSWSNGVPVGPYEEYDENGQLSWKGSYSNGERCGEWFDEGSTVTYDPCPTDSDEMN